MAIYKISSVSRHAVDKQDDSSSIGNTQYPPILDSNTTLSPSKEVHFRVLHC